MFIGQDGVGNHTPIQVPNEFPTWWHVNLSPWKCSSLLVCTRQVLKYLNISDSQRKKPRKLVLQNLLMFKTFEILSVMQYPREIFLHKLVSVNGPWTGNLTTLEEEGWGEAVAGLGVEDWGAEGCTT